MKMLYPNLKIQTKYSWPDSIFSQLDIFLLALSLVKTLKGSTVSATIP